MLEEIISRYNAIEYFVKTYQVDISREKAVLDSALRSFIEATKKMEDATTAAERALCADNRWKNFKAMIQALQTKFE